MGDGDLFFTSPVPAAGNPPSGSLGSLLVMARPYVPSIDGAREWVEGKAFRVRRMRFAFGPLHHLRQ
jgi:hypothetical protein